MCQAKPGSRCASDSEKNLANAKTAYLEALTAHGANLDDPDTGLRVQVAAQEMWIHQLEHAAAHTRPVRPVTDDWRTNVGYGLAQAHVDQAALMPVHPGKDAPKSVKDAYYHLADCRDRLARADAILAADEQVALTGQPHPGPIMGARPPMWTVESDVADAEYTYAQALHPATDTSVGEAWRHLLNRGQMPYDPFANTLHPRASESAPWVRHSRSAGAIDVPALRRATGLDGDVYWDADTRSIIVAPDHDGYMDDEDRETYASSVEASMWQLGYHTERTGDQITVSKVPDIPAWAAKGTASAGVTTSGARPARTRKAA